MFLLLWEMTSINMYIMYLEISKKIDKSMDAITHLQFQIELAQTLSYRWEGWNINEIPNLPHRPRIHCPQNNTRQRVCKVCVVCIQDYCYSCGDHWLCLRKGCYEQLYSGEGNLQVKISIALELYVKSLSKLQFVYSKRKVSTKLIYAPKRGKKKFGP